MIGNCQVCPTSLIESMFLLGRDYGLVILIGSQKLAKKVRRFAQLQGVFTNAHTMCSVFYASSASPSLSIASSTAAMNARKTLMSRCTSEIPSTSISLPLSLSLAEKYYSSPSRSLSPSPAHSPSLLVTLSPELLPSITDPFACRNRSLSTCSVNHLTLFSKYSYEICVCSCKQLLCSAIVLVK